MRRLQSEYNPDTFTLFRPLGERLREESCVVTAQVFDSLGGKALVGQDAKGGQFCYYVCGT
jgi:hypothetical protein